MPKALHDKLERIAYEKGLRGERKDAFVFGIMRKQGWKPRRERRSQKRKSRDR